MAHLRDDRANASPDIVDSALAAACVLPPNSRADRRALVEDLLRLATRWTKCEDGILVEFPDDDQTARTLFEFVLAERHCCPHFTYELGFAPEQQHVTLRLRAGGAHLPALNAIYRSLLGVAREHA